MYWWKLTQIMVLLFAADQLFIVNVLNQARILSLVHNWFLEIVFIHKVSMHVCVSTPKAINKYSHKMKLCSRSKQILQLSSLFMWYLPSLLRIYQLALVSKCFMNISQRRPKWHCISHPLCKRKGLNSYRGESEQAPD